MTRRPETSGASREGEALGAPDADCTATLHGTSTAYRGGCRCRAARDVMAHGQRARTKRRYINRGPLRISAAGTHRRLQALQANGWPRRELSARLGYTSGCLPELAQTIVHIDTAARVRVLYDDLADTRGPSNSARIRARAKGWLPPLAWDDDTIDDIKGEIKDVAYEDASQPDIDDVAVARFLAGDTAISLRRDEKRVAFTGLIAAGWNLHAAAKRVGINGQYARRYAAEAGLTVGERRDDAPMDTNYGDVA